MRINKKFLTMMKRWIKSFWGKVKNFIKREKYDAEKDIGI